MTIRVLIRRDGTIDPERSEILDGRDGPFDRQLLTEIAESWRFRPASLRGEPQDSMEVIHLEYDCRANN